MLLFRNLPKGLNIKPGQEVELTSEADGKYTLQFISEDPSDRVHPLRGKITAGDPHNGKTFKALPGAMLMVVLD
jgi:hypothetical protein